MIFEVLTIFPGLFAAFLTESLMAKARAKGLITVNITNLRDFTFDRHRTVDDRPYGGGAGMVLKAEPLALAIESLTKNNTEPLWVIALTPQGTTLTQKKVKDLAAKPRIALVCGRYEGFDQRFLDLFVHEEISIGDYVVNGGEVPAMAVMEAVARLIPGFLGQNESTLEDSFNHSLLEHPHYTRPSTFRGLEVPKILLSGDHAQVAAYRLAEAVAKTKKFRPDLLARPEAFEEALAVFGRPGSPLAVKNPTKKEG
ncbi:MAG: tRNA (guanosine(37)-N1)-methyltransferase TrmD [Deltaproteobacteria bacterium]|jgi:tRNA (guanine37-N1)-methyltransferase|nr:tRNA (guanosine(37)-N1)-methyltransferase TrmD [Deltaproteobacteria bacterium]